MAPERARKSKKITLEPVSLRARLRSGAFPVGGISQTSTQRQVRNSIDCANVPQEILDPTLWKKRVRNSHW